MAVVHRCSSVAVLEVVEWVPPLGFGLFVGSIVGYRRGKKGKGKYGLWCGHVKEGGSRDSKEG